MKKILKVMFWAIATIFCSIIFCVLKVLECAFRESSDKKEYEPTQHEIMCGEKMSTSDKYFVPDEKL